MQIRPLTAEDLSDLARLYEQFWGEKSSLEKMQATFGRLSTDPNYIFLAATHEGQLIGSLTGIICEELYGECHPFMVVEDVIVDKQHRRKGIATALMKTLEEFASRRNCEYIIFVTESMRSDAHRFYESLGYHSGAYKGFKKRLSSG